MGEVTQKFCAEPLPAGTKIACRIEYDGTRFNGWQSQPHVGSRTVQDELETALSDVAGSDIRVHCAGRTDSGVHGHAQIIHFVSPVSRAPKAWVLGANSSLPLDVRVHWAVPVADDFHARFSAQARRYRYVIANTSVRPAMLAGQVTWQRHVLDANFMHQEAQALIGEQDFSAVRASSCQANSPMRNVHRIDVRRNGDFVVIDITANAFLHHMVRNIAGVLMALGTGRKQAGWVTTLLIARDRTQAADTAAPDGLYLVNVDYPPQFGLPNTPFGPLILGAPEVWS